MKIKSGIEIHQQLDTSKLFCRCPSVLRKDEPDIHIRRVLHAVPGESGEIDIAAAHEAEKGKAFLYQGYSDTNCLLEYDEEPPHLIDEEALIIGLHISLLLNCEILPISQIMRKTVIDGSNTSGFQRTVLIARNGYVDTKYGKVRIANVSLEEDSARIIKDEKNVKIFRLDRLGIPLVEIGTEADIESAEQAKEVALHIGDVLRSCRVKRGIGTIRQDINISIKGHPRVEIKGFQDVKMFIPVIENETKRQEKNIKEKKVVSEVRKANENGSTSFLRPMPGAARMYPETDLPLLRISRQLINKAKSTLPKLRSDIRKEMKSVGLTDEMLKLVTENKLEEFKALLKIMSDGNFIAKVLFLIPKEIAKKEKIKDIDKLLTIDIIENIINEVKENNINKGDVKHVMELIVKGKSFEQAIKLEKADLSEIESEIAGIVKEKPGLSIGGYMGLIMKKFKGKVNGNEANKILQKLLK